MESINALITLGKSHLENGSFHEALESFEQAVSLDQNNPDLRQVNTAHNIACHIDI